MRAAVLVFASLAAALIAACSSSDSSDEESLPAGDPLSGGATSVYDATKLAYAQQAPNLTNEHASAFSFGHSIFKQNWVTAPATTDSMDGLGPRFNQRSCSSCHSNDGRSPPFDSSGEQLGILYRISIPGKSAQGGPLADPTYGTQLRTNAIIGLPVDGVPHVSWTEQPGTYGDGTSYSLRVPTYTIDGWGSGDPAPGLMISPRVGPYTIGLGLLSAIPDADIVAGAHPADPDGVAGHVNHVLDTSVGALVIGRFGWKANVGSILDQTAGAFNGDIGITSRLHPKEDCGPSMSGCLSSKSGAPAGEFEIDDEKLTAIVLYMRMLGVPVRRDVDVMDVRRGEKLFSQIGCASCHRTTFVTGEYPEIPEVAHQTIHPYSDLLVHDMGAGLADNRPDYEATGTEWRTPPLWGIGLLQKVNGHELLLHDARARGMEEAILWHDGEAKTARERFRNAPLADRNALVLFLHSL